MRPGRTLFRLILRLLPAAERARAAAEMLGIYEARMAEAHGARARLEVWLTELAGACAAAWRLGGMLRLRRVVDGGLWDVRFAFRGLRRRPGVAVLAVLTCGLGIGSASAMFSVVDGVLLRPLPWPDAERVVAVYATFEEFRTSPEIMPSWDRAHFSPPEFAEWARRQTSFAEATPLMTRTRHLTGRGPAEMLNLALASEDLFRIADVRPARGRLFTAEDRLAGAAPTAIVTHEFWQAQLGGSAAVGETLVLNDVAYTVVGVLPPGFGIPGFAADIWLPAPVATSEAERMNHTMFAIARLEDGVTLARAQEETAALLRGMSDAHADHADADITHGATVVPLLADRTREVRAPLLLLLAGAGVLLLAACTNFAALLLGAGLDRTSELAVRGALGAGRRRIARLLLTESALLALLGGAAGVLLAMALTRGLVLLAPPGVPRIDDVAVDVRAVGFALGLALVTGIVFGLIPALALRGGNVASRLRASRSTPRQRHRLQATLVVAQVTLATVLLAGGVLLGRTLLHLDRVDPGFAPDPLLGVIVAPPSYRFVDDDGAFADQDHAGYVDRLADALTGVPGVEAVAMTSVLPFSGVRMNHYIEPEGYEAEPGEQLVAEAAYVTGNYLDVIGARPVEGRLLTDADDRADAAPVIVVSRRLAQRFWPGESALGRRLSIPGTPTYTIVGVVADVHDRTLEADRDMRCYAPRALGGPISGSFVLRVEGEPAALATAVRARIARFDEDLPVMRSAPVRDMMDATLAEERYRTRLLLCFAALALFFANAGIYGALSRRVAPRRHEIGVRMALGAGRAAVLASVLREGMTLAFGGIVLGSAIALAGSRLVAAYLSGVSPTDPLTYATIAVILAGAAALAALAPSLRAARVDPMVSLRAD